MFLVEQEFPEVTKYLKSSYSWASYHYGLFSDELLDDIALLNYWGLITVLNESEDIDGENFTTIYKLTDKGKNVVKERSFLIFLKSLYRS